jgi:hypothetical protein
VGPSGNDFINVGIYQGGDIDPNGVLNNNYLVKNTATFRFSGAKGCSSVSRQRRDFSAQKPAVVSAAG